jgi:hypothetical protein
MTREEGKIFRGREGEEEKGGGRRRREIRKEGQRARREGELKDERKEGP